MKTKIRAKDETLHKSVQMHGNVEYMMQKHEIPDARKLVYESEEWEQFFGEF